MFFVLHSALPAPAATPSQKDVFKSIQDNVGQQDAESSGKGMAILLCVVAGLMSVMLIGSRLGRRRAAPKVIHHPGKLLREVLATVPLKPKELKQLKALAEETRSGVAGAEPVESPLTFLLCPSVLSRAIKTHPAKIDRAAMTQIVRKMGVGAK